MCGMASISAAYDSFSNQFLRHQPWPLLFISAYYSTTLPNSSPSSFPSTVLTVMSIIFSTFCVTSTYSFSSVTLTYLIPHLLSTYLDNAHPLFLWSLLIFLLSCISIIVASIQFPSTFSQLNSFFTLLQSLSYCFPLHLHILSACLLLLASPALSSTVYLLPSSYLSCISFFCNLR